MASLEESFKATLFLRVYEQFIYANGWTAMLISAVILLRLLY